MWILEKLPTFSSVVSDHSVALNLPLKIEENGQMELAQKNIIAVDENSSGTSGTRLTRKAIVNQTWKAVPVNNDKVKFQCPD